MSTQTDFYNWQAGQGIPVEPYQPYGSIFGSAAGGVAPASPAPSGGGGVSAPTMPNYLALLLGDPLYQQEKADASAQSIEDKAQRDSAIQSRLIRWGEIPDFMSAGQGLGGISSADLNSILSPNVRQLASQNTSSGMSELARILQAYSDTQRGVKNNLAARGILRSGETGYQLGRANQDYQRTRYDATDQLLQYLSGAQQSYVTAERQRQQQLFAQMQDALNRQWSLYPGLGGSGGGGTSTQPTGSAPTQTNWQAQTDFYNQNPSLAGPYQPYDPTLGQPKQPPLATDPYGY